MTSGSAHSGLEDGIDIVLILYAILSRVRRHVPIVVQ
jgi:hypothetical protein